MGSVPPISSNQLPTHTVVRQYLCCSLLYASSNALNYDQSHPPIEQIHPRLIPCLGQFHLVSSLTVCTSSFIASSRYLLTLPPIVVRLHSFCMFAPFCDAHYARRYISCHATKWVTIWITVVVTTLAQIAVTIRSGPSLRVGDTIHAEIKPCLRIYAITERNKLFAGALSVMIVTQMSFGIYLIVKDGKGPGELLGPFFICTVGLFAPRQSIATDKLGRVYILRFWGLTARGGRIHWSGNCFR